MREYEAIKQEYADGIHKLNDDEYIGDNGLPYCKKCHTPKWYVYDEMACPVLCKCQEEAQARHEEAAARQKLFDAFNDRQKLSLLGERYKNVMFGKAIITDNNRTVYEKCKRYVEKAKEMRDHNIGLYIFGVNSSGKTFLTACICNELLWRGYRCVYTNLANMLHEIQSGYSGGGMGELELLRRLQSYDFAFIDDLGKEFIGRESKINSSKWAESKLFEIINARYNAQKPTVFTSNYSIEELDDKLTFDAAIVERITEMATVNMRLSGDNFRKDTRRDKREIAKNLGIL